MLFLYSLIFLIISLSAIFMEFIMIYNSVGCPDFGYLSAKWCTFAIALAFFSSSFYFFLSLFHLHLFKSFFHHYFAFVVFFIIFSTIFFICPNSITFNYHYNYHFFISDLPHIIIFLSLHPFLISLSLPMNNDLCHSLNEKF